MNVVGQSTFLKGDPFEDLRRRLAEEPRPHAVETPIGYCKVVDDRNSDTTAYRPISLGH